MDLQEKTKSLVALRASLDELEAKYKEATEPLKLQKDQVQSEILKELSDTGQFSARFQFATVTRAVRKTLQVTDEPILIAHLKKEGLTEYLKETVNSLFDGVKKQAVKDGLALPGTEVKETEYVSIRTPDDEAKDRRKIATE